MLDRGLIDGLTRAVAAAAEAILAIGRHAVDVRAKADATPVTAADERSQALLIEAVMRLMPGVGVVAEEMASLPAIPGDPFVLIDPLDGTKEYVAGSSEYTVNLAVISGGSPIAGVVAVPAAGKLYRGVAGRGADRLPLGGGRIGDAEPIRTRPAPHEGLIATVSRSHLDPQTIALLERIGVTARLPCGSALKFCRVAEGTADIYPRLAPTCEWDVAAGHALVEAAGGAVTGPQGAPFRYGNAAARYRMNAFIAWGDRALVATAEAKTGR
ncbi:MAG: 3'(2'),5'-bisphosphate nucleotidase CysQ [Xanthobacteraceae bacterium]|nr:3'(2'),5'-bisphosphate nucleotidase CysQ [Xanthobacteraceae bacterium]